MGLKKVRVPSLSSNIFFIHPIYRIFTPKRWKFHLFVQQMKKRSGKMLLPFRTCMPFAAGTPFLRSTRLPRRDIACGGPIPTDMQRLTAFFWGPMNGEQRTENNEQRTWN
jgi:hypothetical protein